MITNSIDLAIKALKQLDIVAIPTETVYGLAANAESEDAIAKVYTKKNRPLNHPLILHIGKNSNIEQWVNSIPDYAQLLIKQFWPGPLTLVFNLRPGSLSKTITGGQSTVAIRCPAHPLTQQLLDALDFPLVAPSANPFGKVSPTTAEHVETSFADPSLLILDGGRCKHGIESTIIDATATDSYHILRHGSITEDAIISVTNQAPGEPTTCTRAPGRLKHHYQPEKPLYCFENTGKLSAFLKTCKQKVYILSFNKNTYFPNFEGYQLPDNPKDLAYELYFQLRIADHSDAQLLLIELPANMGEWQGVYERLIKAGK